MFDRERLLLINKARVTFFLIFVATFAVTEFGRNIYRPYIYANDIFDFYLADTIGNLTGTAAVIFFNISLLNPRHAQGRLNVFLITIGLIGYELFQHFLPRGRLDWRDMVATVLAGTASLLVYELVYRREINRERAAVVTESG